MKSPGENKKSGKVAESRKEIQYRFDYLDWKDQKKILMAFLDSCATDRLWAYGKLYTLWDPSFEPKVMERKGQAVYPLDVEIEKCRLQE